MDLSPSLGVDGTEVFLWLWLSRSCLEARSLSKWARCSDVSSLDWQMGLGFCPVGFLCALRSPFSFSRFRFVESTRCGSDPRALHRVLGLGLG